jgi:anti-anti-sigma regulatory factor
VGDSVIALKTELSRHLASTTPVTLDCTDLHAVDTGFAGPLLLLAHYSRQSAFRFKLVRANWKVKHYLIAQGVGRHVFE